MPSNPETQPLASKLPIFRCFLSPQLFNILLVPPLAYELAMSLHLNLSAETKEVLLLVVNTAAQVLLADKVKKQLQTLVTPYAGHG